MNIGMGMASEPIDDGDRIDISGMAGRPSKP